MIFLGEKDLLAEGGRRLIYVNPEDKNKLIKIVKQKDLDRKRRSLSFFKKWRNDNSISENTEDFNAYKVYNRKSKEIFKFVPRLFGYTETNLGRGLMTEFVKNYDGSATMSLQDYLKKYGLTHKIHLALKLLYKQLLKYNFITRELKDFNIVVKYISKNNLRLYVIDGFGNQEFIPLSNYIGFLAKRKINKHFKIFLNSIKNSY